MKNTAAEAGARLDTKSVVVTWADGATASLPHLWLRDNCDCGECRAEQTEEKIFHLHTVPVDLAPLDVALVDETLSLTWPDGHRTVYARSAINAAINGRFEPPLRYWNADFSPALVDHEAFFADADASMTAMEAFLSTGVLVVTDAPRVPESLELYSARLGPMREMLFDRIHNVQVDPSGYNVAHTSLPLPPHNDFAGMQWPPSIQALHMLENDCEGGSSVVVDGFGVLDGLRADEPELFEALCTVPVPFRMFDATQETYAVAPLVERDTSGAVTRFRYSNQVMQPMDPTMPNVDAFYAAYHALSKRIMDRANQARFRLEGGHVLLVASHRVLHARDEFVPNAARHLQDAYFEHDNLRNAFFVLRRQAEAVAGA